VQDTSKKAGAVSILVVTLRPEETARTGPIFNPVQVSANELEVIEVKSASMNIVLLLSREAWAPVIPEDARKPQDKVPGFAFQKPTGNTNEICCKSEPVMSLNEVNAIDTTGLLEVIPQGPKSVTFTQAVHGVPMFNAKSSEV